jgi:HEAT repeat protein
MPSSSPAADYPWSVLAALHRLAELLVDRGAHDVERGDAMHAVGDFARERRLDVRVRALSEDPRRAAHPGAARLVEGLHRVGVRRLVVRRGATGRELAQFAGLLARVRDEVAREMAARGESARDDGPEPERLEAARAAIVRGLDELGIWSIQVGTLEAPGAAELEARVPELAAAVRSAMAARDPDAVSAAYAAVHAGLGSVAGRFDGPLAEAAVVATALAGLVGHVSESGARWGAESLRAHQAALAAAIEAWTEPVVRAAVDGALADAAPVLRFVAERAVPALLHRLGEAGSLEERRRCFGALLDAAGGVGPLVPALQDPRWYVVRNVALALGELRDPAAVRPLARCLTGGGDPRVRAAAAEALERLDTPAATHALLPAVRDPEAAVRLVAARAAGRARAQQVPLRVEMLAARLRVEPDLPVAAELLSTLAALAALGDREAAAAVVRVAASREETSHGELLARAALARLLEQPPARLGAALRQLVEQGGDPALRMATRLVLARLARARQETAAGREAA